jgi:transposase
MERSGIHLLHKRGKSQRQIARDLGVDRETVARVLKEGVTPTPLHRKRGSIVDGYREQIARWVKEGLSGARMLELARVDQDQPYGGGHAVFRDAVHHERLRQQHEQASADVPVRFEGLPGEYLQVDWGEVSRFPFRTARHPTRYFLACRLKYSRWMFVRWTTDMRQETLLRGLVDCFVARSWVPWVLVFDNMKVVTSGRDDANQPIWTPALLQLAREFGFHPEACAVRAANQKGSVESLVKFVKGNFLSGRDFADDADLARQGTDWQDTVNARPSRATDVAPAARLSEEAVRGGALPATARDYGFLRLSQVTREALVAVEGNQYSVPIAHVGAPVTVRLHASRVVIWRDGVSLADHPRAPDGTHRRMVDPAHFAPVFARKPRAQVMLYRQALLDLGEVAYSYISDLSRRQHAHLAAEILGVDALFEQHGRADLLSAMELAAQANAFGAEYLRTLLTGPTQATGPSLHTPAPLVLPGVPDQGAVERALALYEAFVQVSESVPIEVVA